MSNNDLIYSYSRQQAINDGILHDVSKLAKEAGFKIPLCITDGVHQLCQPPENDGCQSTKEDFGMSCFWLLQSLGLR